MAEKLKMHTPDGVADNVAWIAQRFPNCVTEAKDPATGEPRLSVDFDMLRQELSGEIVEDRDERYQFVWPDKKKAILLANSPITATLRPDRDASVDFDNTRNLYIEGDNLDVLKCLKETYLGKVKMIYIDPPYNTGNDFVYEDDFSQSIDDYLTNSGQYDNQGNRLFANTESNGRFHTDWLNMMYPRIKIARDLLKEDGVIFISIDDNEVENLRRICNEIFGESNFIANLIWQKKFSRANDALYFSTMHDHILCYAKNNIRYNPKGWTIGLLPRGEELPPGYGNPDDDPRGPWASVILSAKSGSPNLVYEITTPSGRKCLPPSGRYWACNKETFEKWNNDNRIWFGKDGNGTPRKKTFLSEVQQGLRPNTILFQEDVGNNQEAKQETKLLFDDKGVFDGPKPVRLLYTLSVIANLKDEDTILDFFSGSATTAHAIFKFNVENGRKCNFIMVQLPEVTEKNSEAQNAGYNNICEIGEDRIRRAGKKIKDEHPEAKNLDIGFRVLRLDSSNMEDIYYTPANVQQEQLSLFAENVKPDRTSEDLLFQVMLELGATLDSKIETSEIAGKTIFNVGEGYLVACFDENVNDDAVKAIAKMTPQYAVFRDSSFATDSTVANFKQIFKTFSPNTVTKVL